MDGQPTLVSLPSASHLADVASPPDMSAVKGPNSPVPVTPLSLEFEGLSLGRTLTPTQLEGALHEDVVVVESSDVKSGDTATDVLDFTQGELQEVCDKAVAEHEAEQRAKADALAASVQAEAEAVKTQAEAQVAAVKAKAEQEAAALRAQAEAQEAAARQAQAEAEQKLSAMKEQLEVQEKARIAEEARAAEAAAARELEIRRAAEADIKARLEVEMKARLEAELKAQSANGIEPEQAESGEAKPPKQAPKSSIISKSLPDPKEMYEDGSYWRPVFMTVLG